MAPVTEMPIPQEVGVSGGGGSSSPELRKKKKSSSSSSKKRRSSSKKNKESGVRTKFLLESLRQDYYTLQDENAVLREIITTKLPAVADVIFQECCPPRKKVTSIDELASMMPKSMTISEEGEDEYDE